MLRLAHLSNRKVATLARLFSPLSSFRQDLHENIEPRLTAVMLLCCPTVFEMDSEMNPCVSQPFLQVTLNLATPKRLRSIASHG